MSARIIVDMDSFHCLSSKVDLANYGDDGHAASDSDSANQQTKPDLSSAWFVWDWSVSWGTGRLMSSLSSIHKTQQTIHIHDVLYCITNLQFPPHWMSDSAHPHFPHRDLDPPPHPLLCCGLPNVTCLGDILYKNVFISSYFCFSLKVLFCHLSTLTSWQFSHTWTWTAATNPPPLLKLVLTFRGMGMPMSSTNTWLWSWHRGQSINWVLWIWIWPWPCLVAKLKWLQTRCPNLGIVCQILSWFWK